LLSVLVVVREMCDRYGEAPGWGGGERFLAEVRKDPFDAGMVATCRSSPSSWKTRRSAVEKSSSPGRSSPYANLIALFALVAKFTLSRAAHEH
jgi:hypothetical protein